MPNHFKISPEAPEIPFFGATIPTFSVFSKKVLDSKISKYNRRSEWREKRLLLNTGREKKFLNTAELISGALKKNMTAIGDYLITLELQQCKMVISSDPEIGQNGPLSKSSLGSLGRVWREQVGSKP